MRRRVSGFSLLELMIALAIVGFVLAAASIFFVGVVKQYKVQSKITESNVEGVIGLELLRQDLESLGFGLPWDLGSSTYDEPDPQKLTGTSEPPRAVGSVNKDDGPDYLIIRSARVGMASAAGKWTTLNSSGQVRIWDSTDDDLKSQDKVIVVAPGGADIPSRVLLTPTVGATFGLIGAGLSGYVPLEPYGTNIVYGIDNSTNVTGGLKRPFNRADYYIANNTAYPEYTTPSHCAPNTGVLVKAVRAQDVGGTVTLFPLIDCVADMQVVYGLDTTGTGGGVVNSWDDTLGTLTAAQIRTQLVELHLHVLAQVGQRDNSYTYPDTTVYVGSQGYGRPFDFTGINDFRHYRWKVYTIVVIPKSLAN